MRRILSSILLLALALAFLVSFIALWLRDQVQVMEPWLWMRALETGFFGLVTLYAIYNLVKEFREP